MKPEPALSLARAARMSTEPAPSPVPDLLAAPDLRRQLEDFVRRRVPAAEVDDVVQTVLLDALAGRGRPDDPKELTRWVMGIARHKVADVHRRNRREPSAELPDLESGPAPVEELELARWAEEQAGSTRDAQQTLTWMAREGEGEKLETIASEEQIPAARVRQRVSRMRRWMKERWLAELAAVAMFAVLAVVAWRLLRRPDEAPEAIRPDRPAPSVQPETPSPLDQARALRADALQRCDRSEWQPCLDGLDKAAQLDPAGDQEPAVAAARAKAHDALDKAPAPPDSAAPPAPEAPVAPTAAPTSAPAPSSDLQPKAPPSPKAPSSELTAKPVKPSPPAPFEKLKSSSKKGSGKTPSGPGSFDAK